MTRKRAMTPEEAGISPERWEAYKQRQLDTTAATERAKMRAHGVTRRGRAHVLVSQQGRCALCDNDISPADQSCYDKQREHVVCRRCMAYLTARRAAVADGVTTEVVEAYEHNTSPQSGRL